MARDTTSHPVYSDPRLQRKDLTLRAFLVGTGIQNSLSPAIHNHLFTKNGLNARYSLCDLGQDELAGAIHSMIDSGDVLGYNVTAPFKETVMTFITSVDSCAKLIGAVNTVKVYPNGKMQGFNTDIAGINLSLDRLGYFQEGGKATILGAGGAARACTYVLLTRGFKSISILNRTRERATKLIADLGPEIGDATCKVCKFGESVLQEELKSSELLINTISDEMTGSNFPIKIDFAAATERKIRVFDLGYKRQSPLIQSAISAGLPSIDGLMMLAGQAAESFEIWTGIKVSVDELLMEAKRALKSRGKSVPSRGSIV